MSTAVAIFAKTIGLSPVKTRLAKDIGKNKAEEFYRLSVSAIEELLLKVKIESHEKIVPYWALAEEHGVLDEGWKEFQALWTEEGGLGKRMFHISCQLLKKHDKVIMIGTDSPQFERETILTAISKLDEDPETCIIGPAFDGGFYLFGCSRLVAEDIWTSVTYSRKDTLKELLLILDNEDISYSFIKRMGDVDEIKDLKILYEALLLIKNEQTQSQERLMKWLETYMAETIYNVNDELIYLDCLY